MLIPASTHAHTRAAAAYVSFVAGIALGAYVLTTWSPWAELTEHTFCANTSATITDISNVAIAAVYPDVQPTRATRYDHAGVAHDADSSIADSDVSNIAVAADSVSTIMPIGLK